MCPESLSNLEDGSSSCTVPVRPGTNLTLRYAVIVSFGVYLNGTTLDEIAAKVGKSDFHATPFYAQCLQRLKADCDKINE